MLRRRRTLLAAAALMAAGGCSSGDEGPDLSHLSTSRSIEVVATEMAFAPDTLAVDAGTIEVTMHNEGVVLHDLRIEREPFILEAAAGETAAGTVTLAPGRYEVFCSIPGHKEAGMTGLLEVR